MTKFNELPIYRILPPDPDDEMQGMFCVSLVDYPATELDFLQFSNDNNKMTFAVQDKTKHIVSGVSIRCGVPIYRKNGDQEYYVIFQKDDIPLIVEKFMSNNYANIVNIQHDESTLTDKDAIMIESFFIDKERGFCPKEFKDVEDGSWCTSYKILNPELWKLIEDGDVRGFSIELCAGLEKLEPVKLEKQKTEEEQMDEEIMTNCFALDPAMAAAINEATKVVDSVNIEKENVDLNIFNEASVKYAMENHYVVLLNYTGNEAAGFRQGAVSAFGYTSAGNKAIRFHEFSGASASGTMDWKILLWDDIQEFHVVEYLPRWNAAQIGYTGEMGLDGPGFLTGATEAPMW